MKATEARLRSAVERPPADIRLILLHGPDEAGAMAWADRLGRARGDGAERIDLDGATLKSDPARLADEAASLSLFGGARFVRVTGAGDESTAAVEALLAAEQAGNPVVMIAPTVRATGTLVKVALSSDRALAYACYVPEGDGAVRVVEDLARGAGVRLSRDAAMRVAQASDGDRAVMAREIEKLALYMDAAPDRPADAGVDALEAVGASIAEAETDTIVAAVLEGQARAVVEALRQRSEASPIPLMRALARRLIALVEMRGALDSGASMDEVTKRVFFKDKGPTAALLGRWSAPALAQALHTIRRLERDTIAAGPAGDIVNDHAIVGLAQARERRRAG